MVQLSHLNMTTGKKKHSFDYRDLCLKVMPLHFNMLSRFVMGLPRGSTVKNLPVIQELKEV